MLQCVLFLAITLTLGDCMPAREPDSPDNFYGYGNANHWQKTKADFKKLNSNRNEPSWGCSDFSHIFSAMRMDDPSGDKLFIDVGFNKG